VKTCPQCNQSLLLTAFSKDRSRADGLRRACRVCEEARKKAWRKARRDLVSKHNATYRASHPEVVKAANARWSKSESARQAKRATAVLDGLISALTGSSVIPEWRGEVRRVIVK
jgi:DNA-directed RNA polymerase subunit M/transcription elongation factor TFIIS